MTTPSGLQPTAPFPAPVAVALAVLERDGRWLLQLRDDVPGIVAPGHWGLFGGHLEPGETPEQALRRELLEEIGWQAGALHYWFSHHDPHRIAHVFRAQLTVPPEQLDLREGQDLALATAEDLGRGALWSDRLAQERPLAPSVQLVARMGLVAPAPAPPLLPLRLQPGDELGQALQQVLVRHGLEAAQVLSGIGSLSALRLRLAGRPGIRQLRGDLEILSLAGTLSPDGAHLHIAVADAQGQVMGGHLGGGALVRTTAELLLAPLAGWRFRRDHDAGTGCRELRISPRTALG